VEGRLEVQCLERQYRAEAADAGEDRAFADLAALARVLVGVLPRPYRERATARVAEIERRFAEADAACDAVVLAAAPEAVRVLTEGERHLARHRAQLRTARRPVTRNAA